MEFDMWWALGKHGFGHIGIVGVIRDHKIFGKKNLCQKVRKKKEKKGRKKQ